jgi:hypothetical protein
MKETHMPELYLIGYLLATAVLLDWLCRSIALRRTLYVAFMAIAITRCNQLGERQVLQLDGGQWALLFALAGQRLLFKRSRYWRDGED